MVLHALFSALVLIAGCYTQLTVDDFSTPASILSHFADLDNGIRRLFMKVGQSSVYNRKVNKTGKDLKDLRQDFTVLLDRLEVLEAENKEKNNQLKELVAESKDKDKQLLRLDDHVKVLENNIVYVQSTFTEKLKKNEELINKKFATLATQIQKKDETITTLATQVEKEKKRIHKLSRKFYELKGVVRNMNRNLSTSIQSLYSNSKWLMEYVRNKSEQDIGVHMEVNRMAKDIYQLQDNVHLLEKIISSTPAPGANPTLPAMTDEVVRKTLIKTSDIKTPPTFLRHKQDTSSKVTNRLQMLTDNFENDYTGTQDYDDYQEHFDERLLYKNN